MNRINFDLSVIRGEMLALTSKYNDYFDTCFSFSQKEKELSRNKSDRFIKNKGNSVKVVESFDWFNILISNTKEIYFKDFFGFDTVIKFKKYMFAKKGVKKVKKSDLKDSFSYCEIKSENPEFLSYFFYLGEKYYKKESLFLINLLKEKDVFKNDFFKKDYKEFKKLYNMGKESKNKLLSIIQGEVNKVDEIDKKTSFYTSDIIKNGFFIFSKNNDLTANFNSNLAKGNSLLSFNELTFEKDFFIFENVFLSSLQFNCDNKEKDKWYLDNICFKNKINSKRIVIDNEKKQFVAQKKSFIINLNKNVKEVVGNNDLMAEFLIENEFKGNINGFRFPKKFSQFGLASKIVFNDNKKAEFEYENFYFKRGPQKIFDAIKNNLNEENKAIIYFILLNYNKKLSIPFKKTLYKVDFNWEENLSDDILNLVFMNSQHFEKAKYFYRKAKEISENYLIFINENLHKMRYNDLMKKSRKIFTF